KNIPYLSYDKIINQKKNGPDEKVIGIKLLESGVLRENYSIQNLEGHIIGLTTSGTYSPSLKEGIGMAILKKEYCQDKTPVKVEIRGGLKDAIVFTGSFVTGSVRKN
ncbi:MAG: glycine cleavage system protein T, partial [Leptospira sp.]|nr:glycine cleavage system protein T [Leptospira sp.]